MTWTTGPDRPQVADGEIHVWRTQLDLTDAWHERLRATLSADEVDRASRFLKPQHRRRFEAARGVLRDILSRYEQRPAAALPLATGAFGKPLLSDSRLRFNVSHSGAHALFGVSRDRDVGVDIEAIDPRRADDRIAERYFSEAECAALQHLPTAARDAAFFRCWTRKEAYLKAIGTGLSGSLRGFTVSIDERELSFDVNGVWIAPLDAGTGVAAAIAVVGSAAEVRGFAWSPAATSNPTR